MISNPVSLRSLLRRMLVCAGVALWACGAAATAQAGPGSDASNDDICEGDRNQLTLGDLIVHPIGEEVIYWKCALSLEETLPLFLPYAGPGPEVFTDDNKVDPEAYKKWAWARYEFLVGDRPFDQAYSTYGSEEIARRKAKMLSMLLNREFEFIPPTEYTETGASLPTLDAVLTACPDAWRGNARFPEDVRLKPVKPLASYNLTSHFDASGDQELWIIKGGYMTLARSSSAKRAPVFVGQSRRSSQFPRGYTILRGGARLIGTKSCGILGANSEVHDGAWDDVIAVDRSLNEPLFGLRRTLPYCQSTGKCLGT